MLSTVVGAGAISGNKNTFCNPGFQTNKERQTLNDIYEKNTYFVRWYKCSEKNKSRKWNGLTI